MYFNHFSGAFGTFDRTVCLQSGGAGLADRNFSVPNDPSFSYQTASGTKGFTAAAALTEEAWTPAQEGAGNLYGLGFWISSRNPKIVFLEGFDPGVQFFSFYNRDTKRSLTICLNDEKMNCDEVFARYYSEVE